MRILTVTAPGGADARAALTAALTTWSRGLDIRLRFLNIGIEEAHVDAAAEAPPGEAAAAGLRDVETAIARERPALVVVHGGGAAALAAAVSAAKAGVPVLRTAAGVRGGPDEGEERAADRLAAVRVVRDRAALEALRAEGLDGILVPSASGAWGEAAAQAVLRAVREA